MEDKALNARLLGLTSSWGVEKVELKPAAGVAHVFVALPSKELYCGELDMYPSSTM